MSQGSTTATAPHRSDATTELGRAAVAGVLAGVVFGLLIQFVLQRMTAIGALYTLGQPSLTVGWVAHFAHSALFGLVFAVLTWWAPLARLIDSPPGSVAAGAGYGAFLWFVNIGFVWPLWLNAVGVRMLPFPYLSSVRPLVGHLVWGLLLGAVYWGLKNR